MSVIKWLGGKSRLLPEIKSLLPKSLATHAPAGCNTYFEPFVGSGAVVFSLQPVPAVINDSNEQLINLYKQIQQDPFAVISSLHGLTVEKCDQEYFNHIRTGFNENINIFTPEQAARFIWLNKYSFNGLYRVNKKGLYNSPYNKQLSAPIPKDEEIMKLSHYLQNVEIRCEDFYETCLRAEKGDFVYMDPPYVPLSSSSNFTSYTAEKFDGKDFERLFSAFEEMDEKGCYVMMSNNDVEEIRERFEKWNVHTVGINRLVAGNGGARGKINELIITNY